MTDDEIPSVSVDEVPEGATVLDVREPDEWDGGHIEGARHLPLGDLAGHADSVGPAGGGRLVVTCRAGGRSSRAVAYLRSAGVDAVNLDGGMQAWAAAGRPYVRDDGGTPEVR